MIIRLQALTLLYLLAATGSAPEPEWTGQGAHRILLAVAPVDIGNRQSDEMPAQVRIDFAKILKGAGHKGRANLATLQIARYDPVTGKALPYDNYLHNQTEYDRPLRWYDDAIPDPFPDRDHSVKSPWVYRPRWGYYYDVIGEWNSGRLAWSHTQEKARPSHYAVYFDLLGEGQKQADSPPRDWIGDGSKRTAPFGPESTGLYHVDCQMVDFNQDGLLARKFHETSRRKPSSLA